MASPYRPLRPAPLAGGSQQLSSRESPQGERNRATLACQPCRDKRRKCSGERPVCRECSRRRLTCAYAARPGQTRMASLRENNERMKSDLETSTELYWYLQTKPKDELGDVLSSIQAGADPSEVIEAIRSRTSSTGAMPSSSSASEVPLSDLRPAIVRDATSNSSLLLQSMYTSHETQTPTELPATELPVSESSTQPPRAFECLYRGTEAFFTYTGCVFYIYDKGEAEASYNNLKPYFETPGKSWLDFVSQESLPSHLKPALCSLCIMAAVGLQYIKNPVPALDFIPSSSDGSYEFVGAFYESARHLLEAVIEVDILEAMKLCAALTLFNTIGHATVAMAYADMGINFALNLGPNLQIRPSNYSETLWTRHKRVVRTLVTLRSWLVSTLGYVHSDHTGLQLGSQWLMDIREMTPDEIVQQELSKVVQIEADLLRTIDNFRELSPVLLSSTKRDLARWHQQLPEWMHLKVLLDASGNTTMTRRTVYLVHLFYLSASMLLARLAHSAQRSPHAEGNTMKPRYDVEEVRVAAGDGVEAARTAARILQLQMDEQTIYQRCWNCEFSAYMACLTLLHSAAQMQLHDYSPQVWKKELCYARSCLDVLEFCGKADKVAVHFEQVAQGYYNTLATQVQTTDDIDVLDAPPDFDYLFSISSSSPPHLVQMSRDLLERVSCPFDSPISLYHEGTLKAGLGSHTIPQFNAIFEKDTNSRPAVEMALSSMPSGQFIGSSQPHGWDVFLNFKTL